MQASQDAMLVTLNVASGHEVESDNCAPLIGKFHGTKSHDQLHVLSSDIGFRHLPILPDGNWPRHGRQAVVLDECLVAEDLAVALAGDELELLDGVEVANVVAARARTP